MNNIFDTVRDAIAQAKFTQRAVDENTNQMATLIRGRLRSADVDRETLVRLKRELQDFDATRKRWK